MNKVKLNEICQFLNGYAFKSKQYVDDGIRIIRIANVQKGKIIDDAPCFYPSNRINEIEKYLLSENDLLISLTGNVGRVGLLTRDMLPAALNQRVSCIRILNKNVVFFKYLYYYLQQNAFERDCIKASNGVAQLNLSTKWLENYQIFLPSLEEQQLIVTKIEELFSKLDKGVEELNKIKEQLKIYRQAVLKEAYNLSNDKVKLENLCFFITKGTTPPKGLVENNTGVKEVPFLKVYNLTFDGQLDFSIDPTFVTKETHTGFLNRSICLPGDVLMNIVGPPIGKVSIVPNTYPEWNINQAIVRYRCLEKLNNKFLAYFLLFSNTVEQLKSKGKTTAGQFNLTLEICRELQIPLPTIEKQVEIVDCIEQKLSVCDKIEQTVNESLQKAESLRQSILKQAFEGKLV